MTPDAGRKSSRVKVMAARAFSNFSLSRRRFLKTSAAAALALPFSSIRSRAAALKPVSLTLDWLYQGPNAGFLLAKDKGFYSEAGLDVAITSGKGSVSTAQLVASKAAQVGFSDGFVVGNGISKGMGIKGVGAIFRRNPAAIMAFADSAIKTPKDLAGKTIAITSTSAVFQQWPAFCKGAGVDASNIQIVNIDPAGIGPALISGKVDAIGGYVGSYIASVELRSKKDLRVFWMSDYGVTVVSNSIIVHQDTLKGDPELVRAFVTPTIKGFLYGRQHPEEAVAAVSRYLETADPAISRRELEISWKTWVTPNTKGKPLGWSSETDWASTIEVLRQYGGVAAPLAPQDIYTNEFVPTGPEYVPPEEA
jgi:NitT/TauT family transport system substrate-binding protein